MDLLRMIAELEDERQRLDKAIEALEHLSAVSGNHRLRRRPARQFKQADRSSDTNNQVLNVRPSKKQES